MSQVKSLEEIKKFWPKTAPDINNVAKYVAKYKNEKIVIKCGGNVLIDPELFKNLIEDVAVLYKLGLTTVIVHGGGPRIKNKLSELNIERAANVKHDINKISDQDLGCVNKVIAK